MCENVVVDSENNRKNKQSMQIFCLKNCHVLNVFCDIESSECLVLV